MVKICGEPDTHKLLNETIQIFNSEGDLSSSIRFNPEHSPAYESWTILSNLPTEDVFIRKTSFNCHKIFSRKDILFLSSKEGLNTTNLEIIISPMTSDITDLGGVSVVNNGYEVVGENND